MLSSIWDDIKRQYNYGDVVTRIIIVNVAVFVVINLLKVFLHHGNGGTTPGIYMDLRNFFCMSSDPYFFITHPWGMFTHMFMHEGFMHILFNMLFLYWFGRIVEDLVGNKRILPLFYWVVCLEQPYILFLPICFHQSFIKWENLP